MLKNSIIISIFTIFCFYAISPAQAQVIREIVLKENMTKLDIEILGIAKKMGAECERILENSIRQKAISEEDLFNTLYFPEIPLNSPLTFTTFYSSYIEKTFQPLEDRYLQENPKIVFAILVDRNGYIAAHNSKFSKPRTGNLAIDLKQNRTRRIFNDITGFSAAINKKNYLLQIYSRDTGEIFKDMSVPVLVNGQHWGAVRIGYTK